MIQRIFRNHPLIPWDLFWKTSISSVQALEIGKKQAKADKEKEAEKQAKANKEKKAEKQENTTGSEKNPEVPNTASEEFEVGRELVTRSQKNKNKYNQQSGSIISVGKKHVTVKLLTSEATGQTHKFDKANVTVKKRSNVEAAPADVPDLKRQKATEIFGADLADIS